MNNLKGYVKKCFPLLLLVAFIAGCGGNNDNVPASSSLVSIEVTPSTSGIAKGTTVQFTATGIYSDNAAIDLTSSVTWSSSDTAKATIASTGVATGHEAGSATIKAQSGAVSGSATLAVTNTLLASITVTPTNPVFAKGTKVQFTATGIFTDNSNQDLSSQVVWLSSNESVMTVSSTGVATSVGAGSATITAKLGLIEGANSPAVTAATLTSIAVTTTKASISQGKTSSFTATGLFSDDSNQDLTNQVTWSSSAVSVATVSNAADSKGLVTSVAAGTATIKAAVGTVEGISKLTVTAATLTSITVTPANPTIAKGRTGQFIATGTFSDNSTQNITALVTWSSSAVSVATISNAGASKGLATTVAAGAATIKAIDPATLKQGATTLTVTAANLTSIAITPSNSSISKGRTSQFTATGTFSDNSTQNITSSVTWSSSSEAVATISNAAGSIGVATAIKSGSTTITATSGNVAKADTLTVTNATLSSIAITPMNPVIVPLGSQQFTATGTFSDNSSQDITSSLTWSSSDDLVASISNAAGSVGQAAAGIKGATTITAIDPVTKESRNTTLTVALLPVNLGTAGNFVILSKTGVSTTGTTAVTGNIGLSPAAATYITGFDLILDSTNTFSRSSLVTGKLYAADYTSPTPANLTTAVGDMETAFSDAAGRKNPDFTEKGAGDISGLTLAPGLYKWGTGVSISSAGVTLSGGANDVWIFQIAQDLTVSNSAIVTLNPGVQAKNIFWQVSGKATLGTATDFKGILLSQTLISFNTGAVMNGRALAQTAVTLDATTVTAP